MNYELGKLLKDGGFPQNVSPDGGFYWISPTSTLIWVWGKEGELPADNYVLCPSLSKLIEECERDDYELMFHQGHTSAQCTPATRYWNVALIPARGAFRERWPVAQVNEKEVDVAVANLWHALNQPSPK